MKTLRVQDEVHEKLTTLVGELTAQSGKLQTYADALLRLIETSIILPDELIDGITDIISRRKIAGYASTTEFAKDAIRRRLEEIKEEDYYVKVPIPREEYELLNEAIEEAGAPFKNADDYIRQHIREKIEEYEEFRTGKK